MTAMTTTAPPSGGREAHPPMLDAVIEGPVAWRRQDLREADWLVPLGGAALAELQALAARHAAYDGDLDLLTPEAMDWPATMQVMADVKARLDRGVGLAVLDRLPVEGWTEPAARVVSWLLSNSIAPAVMQKWNVARRMYDVRDTGMKLGYGVRRSVTNLEQEYHTDGPWLSRTADFMGLACVRQAAEGGMSRVASLATVHNRLRETAPALLARLYRPFYWDRQAEHGPDESPTSWLPIYAWDGRRLTARYYDDYIHNGYRLMRAELDEEGAAALAAMRAAIEAPENSFDFRLAPGQLFFLNNHLLTHGRTGFKDEGVPAQAGGGRLVLRFWLRAGGGTGFEAQSPASA